jgi:tetratricopeptide (TPR) repeat protein
MRVATLSIFSISMIGLAVTSSAAQAPSPARRPLRERGIALEARGDTAGAKAAYLEAVALDPRDAEARFLLGTLLLRLGDWPGAVDVFEQAKALRPQHVDTCFYLAQAYYLDGRLGPATATIARAARLAPERADIAQKHGEYLCEGQSCKEGLISLQKAYRLDRDLPAIEFDLGMAYHKQAAVPEAQRYLELALRRDPDNLVAARFLADVLGRQDQWDKAKPLYDLVAAREPRNAWALYGVGRSWVAMGKPEAALEPLRAALAVDPAMAEAHFQLGQALRQLGRRDESLRELEIFKALRDRAETPAAPLKATRTPSEDKVWNECLRLVAEGREAEALAYLDALPRDQRADADYLLGVLYFNIERPLDAARLLARAVAKAPADAGGLAFLARAYVAAGQYEAAERELERAHALGPEGEIALLARGELAYARAAWADAIRYFEEARTSQVPALLKLCRAYVVTRDPEKAARTAELVRAFARGDPTWLRQLDSVLHSGGGPDTPASPPP